MRYTDSPQGLQLRELSRRGSRQGKRPAKDIGKGHCSTHRERLTKDRGKGRRSTHPKRPAKDRGKGRRSRDRTRPAKDRRKGCPSTDPRRPAKDHGKAIHVPQNVPQICTARRTAKDRGNAPAHQTAKDRQKTEGLPLKQLQNYVGSTNVSTHRLNCCNTCCAHQQNTNDRNPLTTEPVLQSQNTNRSNSVV